MILRLEDWKKVGIVLKPPEGECIEPFKAGENERVAYDLHVGNLVKEPGYENSKAVGCMGTVIRLPRSSWTEASKTRKRLNPLIKAVQKPMFHLVLLELQQRSSMKFSPVISLIVVEIAGFHDDCFDPHAGILVAIRDPTTNVHHPNVLSVPTQRIPRALFEAIKATCRVSPAGEESSALETEWVDNARADGHHPVIYAVESLLSQKLGVSEALSGVPEPCPFRAKPVWIERGCVGYPVSNTEEVETEAIEMLGILVLVLAPGAFPAKTRSYNRIFWAPVSQFLLSYEQKDVERLDCTLNAVELCIHGLCVATAYKFLRSHICSKVSQ